MTGKQEEKLEKVALWLCGGWCLRAHLISARAPSASTPTHPRSRQPGFTQKEGREKEGGGSHSNVSFLSRHKQENGSFARLLRNSLLQEEAFWHLHPSLCRRNSDSDSELCFSTHTQSASCSCMLSVPCLLYHAQTGGREAGGRGREEGRGRQEKGEQWRRGRAEGGSGSCLLLSCSSLISYPPSSSLLIPIPSFLPSIPWIIPFKIIYILLPTTFTPTPACLVLPRVRMALPALLYPT